jgi:O-antigen polymerase
MSVTNMITLCVIALCMTTLWLCYFSRKGRGGSLTLPLLYVGSVILFIPILYMPEGNSVAYWRISGLIGGLLFLFSCSQVRYTRRVMYLVFVSLLLLAALQAFLALQQLFIPGQAWVPLYGRRVYGWFFQPNVLASFVATGLALALMLLILPGFALTRDYFERARQACLLILLGIFSALLVWMQSRTGWLGASIVILLFMWQFARWFPQSCLLAGMGILTGLSVGVGVLMLSGEAVAPLNHEHSNLARWSMLKDSLAMVREKPWLGWGYGSFEYGFQHFRINQTSPTEITEITRHPHNEILLWVVEGGLAALAGILIILFGLLRVVRQALRHDRQALNLGQRMAGMATALSIALIPIAVHTQLEYPFYQSGLHFAVFMLLLAMANRIGGGVMVRRPLSPVAYRVTVGAMPIMMLGVTIIMGFALNGRLVLEKVEKFGMEDVVPLQEMPALSRWLNHDRVVFDEQVNALLSYNRTGDERLLEHYSQWAQAYLTRRIDKNVYASLIQILIHQEQLVAAEQYRRDGARFFPRDPRFIRGTEKAVVVQQPKNKEVS